MAERLVAGRAPGPHDLLQGAADPISIQVDHGDVAAWAGLVANRAQVLALADGRLPVPEVLGGNEPRKVTPDVACNEPRAIRHVRLALARGGSADEQPL